MDRRAVEQAADLLLRWQARVKNTTRLERHEAMKAILFGLSASALLEHRIETNDGRKSRIDFIDDETAIEIDDGPNEKSLRKLASIANRDRIWVLILSKGKGGRARSRATRYGIDVLRIFVHSHPRWEWLTIMKTE